MKDILQQILDWAEVWALLIPITVFIIRKPKEKWIRPLKYYLLTALVINFTGDVIWKRMRLGIGDWMQKNLSTLYDANGDFSNVILYNIHSILRFVFFAWLFHYLGKMFRKVNLMIPALFLIMCAITFIFYKDIRDFSSLLLGTEAALLLIYCLLYYLNILRDEESNIKRLPTFWAVTGLSIYVVINFPIFLFYTVLAKQSENFAINIWDVHNISYIILCLLISKSLYAAKQ